MVYLDWAATTPPDPDALQQALETAHTYPGNPSSGHALGAEASRALSGLRARFAAAIGAKPSNVVFTSGGTESNYLSFAHLLARTTRGQVILSGIEHPALYENAKSLEKLGFSVNIINPRADGLIYSQDLSAMMSDDCCYVGIMAVNNETGVIQPIQDLVAAVRQTSQGRRNVHFHCDAVQALGKIEHNPSDWGVDSAVYSAHKLRGPRGVGALYLSQSPEAFLRGGGQEDGRRSGTENLFGIAGFVAALEKRGSAEALRPLRDALIDGLAATGARFAHDYREIPSAPHIVNCSFAGVPGEVLVRVMSDAGYAIGTGSACSSKKKGRGRVLKNFGKPEEYWFSAVRVSIGELTTEQDVEGFLGALRQNLQVFRPR